MINPAAYVPSPILRSRPDPKAVLAFTGNYNWLGAPIGYLRANGVNITSVNAYLDIRPAFVYDSKYKRWIIISGKEFAQDQDRYPWAFQAGPTLVRDGKVAVLKSEEKFRDDAVRVTSQIAVGVTPAGKLIVANSFTWSMNTLASYMQSVNCVQAMKMDAGSQTILYFTPDADDTINREIRFGHTGTVSIGVQFLRKQ